MDTPVARLKCCVHPNKTISQESVDVLTEFSNKFIIDAYLQYLV